MRNSEKRALRKECRNRKVSVLLNRLTKIEIKKWRRQKPVKRSESLQNLSSKQVKPISKEQKHKTIDKSNWVFGCLNGREDKFAKELAQSEAKKKLTNFKIPKKENENQGKSNHISTGNGKLAPMATTPLSNFKIPKKSVEDKIKEKHLTKEIKQDDFVFKIPKPIDKKYKAKPSNTEKSKKNDASSSKNKRKMGDYFKEKSRQSLQHSK